MPRTETISCDQVEVAIRRAGAGAPLLFLPDALIGAVWLPVHDQLAERFEVVQPQHPGYGGGDAPPWLERVADLANFYLDLMATLDFRRVHLVGAALGGWIAAELAVRNTARLASLTLIDAWGLRVVEDGGIDLFADNDEQALRDLFAEPKTAAADDAVARMMAPEAEDALLKGKMLTAKLAWQPRLHDPHLGKWLHRVDVPALIVWGERDRVLPPAYAVAWQRAIPGARRIAIPGAGHVPYVEQPDKTAAAIIHFLAQERAAS